MATEPKDMPKFNMIHMTDPINLTLDNNEKNAPENPLPVPLIGDTTDISEALGAPSNVENSELTLGTMTGSYNNPEDLVPAKSLPACILCMNDKG